MNIAATLAAAAGAKILEKAIEVGIETVENQTRNVATKMTDKVVKKLKPQKKKQEKGKKKRTATASVPAVAPFAMRQPLKSSPPTSLMKSGSKQSTQPLTRTPKDIPSRYVYNVPGTHFKPMRVKSTKVRRGKDNYEATRFTGSVFLGLVAGPASADSRYNKDYQPLVEVAINPLALGLSRLQKFAQLYQEYIFERLTFKFIPVQGTDYIGQSVMFGVQDAEFELPEPGSVMWMQSVLELQGTKMGNWFEELSFDFPLDKSKRYYISPDADGDVRLTTQGNFTLASGLRFTATGGEERLGTLLVDFDVQFFAPALSNTPALQLQDVYMRSTGGYSSVCQVQMHGGFTAETLYGFYMPSVFDTMSAMKYYWFFTAAIVNGNWMKIYENRDDAYAQTNSNEAVGGWSGQGPDVISVFIAPFNEIPEVSSQGPKNPRSHPKSTLWTGELPKVELTKSSTPRVEPHVEGETDNTVESSSDEDLQTEMELAQVAKDFGVKINWEKGMDPARARSALTELTKSPVASPKLAGKK